VARWRKDAALLALHAALVRSACERSRESGVRLGRYRRRFVRGFVRFSRGKVLSDDRHANAGEIGRPNESYRRIRIESGFGKMQVNLTDGHLPYPFGHEITGYDVKDLDATLDKAKITGAKVLSPRFDAKDRVTAIVEFPGGYIAEIHSTAAH
jgi:hypothetical protein